MGTSGPLDQILNGPSHVTDGTQNLVGALRQSMAALGARTIADMHDVEIVLRAVGGDRGEVLAAAREVAPVPGAQPVRASMPGIPRADSSAAKASRSSTPT